MKNIINFLTNILAILISIAELLVFWIPKIYKKLKELEELLHEAGTKRRDLKDGTKK